MAQFLFQCGTHPEISYEEVSSRGVKECVYITKNTLLGSTKEDPKALMAKLGSIKKISRIIGEYKNIKDIEIAMLEHLLEDPPEGKILFGINIFGKKAISGKQLGPLLKTIRTVLKKAQKSCRFLNNGTKNVSDVFAMKTMRKKRCSVFEIVENHKGIIVSVIEAIQDIDAYSLRDYKKPFRDAKVGMLPPKLAQTLISLAVGTQEQQKVYDPFCGSGTVLIEALLQNHTPIGSDISEEMVRGSQKNIEFIIGKYHQKQFKNTELFEHDATKPFKKIDCDAIVTEGYLGPPRSFIPPQEALDETMRELSILHLKFFQEIGKKLKPGTPIVMTFPYINKKGKTLDLSRNCPRIESLGYTHHTFSKGQKFLVHGRENQIVHRAIFKFTKK